jgi:hypothetical protein
MKKDESLQDKIHSWLETQGYTTEMKVAMSLRNAGLEVLQSYYYDDPETKTSREIDVICRLADKIGLLEIYSVIECKKSQKPWVLFTSEFAGSNRVTSFAVASEINLKVIASNIQDMIQIDWLRKDGRTAYGITEAFTTKEDTTFKAGVGATKAAIALSQSESFSGPGLNFFFPTIVFEGQLFECYLNKNGNAMISEINSSFLNFQIQFGDRQGASIHIVRLEALNKYCQELNETFSQLKKHLKQERIKYAIQLNINPDLVED